MVTVMIVRFFSVRTFRQIGKYFVHNIFHQRTRTTERVQKSFLQDDRRKGTCRFGALRLSAASYQMRTLSSPPNNLLPRHTQSAFLTHLAFVVLSNVPNIAVTFQMPSNDPSVRKPFIPYYICLELVLLSSVFWVML